MIIKFNPIVVLNVMAAVLDIQLVICWLWLLNHTSYFEKIKNSKLIVIKKKKKSMKQVSDWVSKSPEANNSALTVFDYKWLTKAANPSIEETTLVS